MAAFPVSSLIAQGTEFPLAKPAGFHWDLFLLGLTTGVAGLLGLPFPNGLIPQAPFHTESLCVTEVVADTDERGESKGHYEFKATHVVEQRVSNLAQGLLTLGTMTGPLLVILHLIPQGVLAGLFFIMGVQALEANGITAKLLFLARDVTLTSAAHPFKRIERRAAIWLFVAIELVGFGATFAITQTVAAVGFPVFILALIPVRALLLPRWFTPAELALLDGPTASPFTMESVGGTYGGDSSSDDDNNDNNNNNNNPSATSIAPNPPSRGDTTAAARLAASSSAGFFRSGDATAIQSEVASLRKKSDEDLAELGELRATTGGERDVSATTKTAAAAARRRRSSAAVYRGDDDDDDYDDGGAVVVELQSMRARRGQGQSQGQGQGQSSHQSYR